MPNTNSLPFIVSKVFEMLNTKKIQYAVLRNYEGLPYTNKSRDIDILIKKNEYSVIKNNLVRCFKLYNYKLVTFFESERLRTFVCGKVENESIEIIQFDFFIHTSAYGHIILTDEELLNSRTLTNGIYHVSKEFEFLDKYLYIKYIGAEYPVKYENLKEQMSKSNTMNEILMRLFGINSLITLEKMPTNEFRKRNKKLGRESIRDILLFWKYYIQNFIFYKGFSIGFTGPDGSGKTTVIEMLSLHLSNVYSKISRYHFRPMMFGNISDIAHMVGLKKEVDREYDKPHRSRKVGCVNSLIRLLYYSIDYVAGYLKRVRISLIKRELVIFDRYYNDIICDSRRSRINLNHKFLYWFGKLFIPSLDYNILLTADTNLILTRKQELDAESIKTINEKIEYLKNKKGYYKVMNESSPQLTVAEILNIVFNAQHKKNLRKF